MAQERRGILRSLNAWIVAIGILGFLNGASQAGPMDSGGQFSVNEIGAATYTIPIQVPPGTAGIEPKLALSYNSQTGNGLLGVGWSLSGLSAVTRCPRTVAQDGVKGGINFDANDRYCLDGQRLVAISGPYGADGTEYRTERESFSKVISYGTAGTGPAWFKVWTKAGQILEYGNTADSRIEAQGKPSARVWALNKIGDTKGNFLTVTYTEDSANGDYTPSRIDYTDNAGASLVPNNSVQFVYETRPDSTPLYFAGSLINSTQRLKTLQTWTGATPTKEYRLTYQVGTTTQRSRIATLTECAMPDATCKPPVTPTWTEYGSNTLNAGSNWTTLVTSFLADVNGDGLADLIAQQSDGIYVALSNGTGVGSSSNWISSFGTGQGYSDANATPIFLLDVNADGLADVVGFASDGVYVALSNGAGFNAANKWISDFGTGAGWTNLDTYPRTFADVNGDGRPDLVGFKNDGVYIALNTVTGFSAATKWTGDFGTASTTAYATQSANPRIVQDINGDGLPDIVGFANGGTYVALNTGTGYAPATLWLADFGVTTGYTTQDTYPRTLADVNGDGLPDIVGFKSDGVYVAINTGTGLQAASQWLADFGTATGTTYSSQKGFPRYVTDVNGDGKADIVGFAAGGVQVALSTGTGFSTSSQWVAGFGSTAGYTTGMPRQLADVDGDGFPDIVGTLGSGTSVARTARTIPPDLITAFADGLGTSSIVTYLSLTDTSIYAKGTGAVYPLVDIVPPYYAVLSVNSPNALGSGYTATGYKYGGLRVDLTGRGMLGFGWQQATQVDTNISSRTDYRQDWPYLGLPKQVGRVSPGYGNNGLLRLVTNTYSCINPQTGTACAVAAGNRYFPYISQSTEANWDDNGTALPVVVTANTFDGYGNATQVTVTASDGYGKTTTNTYSNDTTNWFLGRLARSQATSTTGATNPAMSDGIFNFTQTIAVDTVDYNIKNAAIAAGWDQVAPLHATITINAGVYVGSSSASGYAFDTGAGFPPGSTLVLINNGNIQGAGGAGGAGGTQGSAGFPGGAGGTALRAGTSISITNSGVIGGGGGGGAGGASANGYCGCDDGGSYWGMYVSLAGGAGGRGQGFSTGLKAIAGAGGTGQTCAAYGPWCTGESGGNGLSGATLGNAASGAAGAAVTGNVNISWLATGTRYGSLDSLDVTSPIPANGEPFYFTPTISANTANYNIKNVAIAAGWNQTSPLHATITISAGAYVYSTSTAAAAFDTGNGYPASSVLTLINNGWIVGAGGKGGDGGFWGGNPGQIGGLALRAQNTIFIANNGTISGGGGGGGAGSAWGVTPGSGGGGGAGYFPGAGGAAAYWGTGGQLPGSPGTLNAGGTGGNGSTQGYQTGGNGGNLGAAGAKGQSGALGGASGACTSGNSNITWLVAGTRLGVRQ